MIFFHWTGPCAWLYCILFLADIFFLLNVQASSTADNGGLNGVGESDEGGAAAEMLNDPAPESSKYFEFFTLSLFHEFRKDCRIDDIMRICK